MLHVLIVAGVLACGFLTMFLAWRVLRQGEPQEPKPLFVIEDAYTQVPEIRAARQRAMAVPRKRPAIRTRNSR